MFIFPFVVIGRIITYLKPLRQEYRIFYFFPFYHTGGAEKVHMQIAVATGGNDCIIYFTKKSADDRFLQEFKNSGCTIKIIPGFTDNKFFYFLNLIYRGIISGYINKQKIKPILFNGQCNFGYKVSPWVNKSIKQIELIHSLNTFSYIRIPFIPFISQTIMISKKRIEDHRKLYQRYEIPASFFERIIYISNAIPIPAANEVKLRSNLKVLYVGRGTAEKRVQLVVAVAQQLHDKNIQFELLGDVTESIAPEKNSFIKFYGNVNDEVLINKIYSGSHVCILTSKTEGFPMVIMEAMAHGCVILATPVGDIPYHVANDINGFLFSDVNNEDLIIQEAIEKILWADQHREKLNEIALTNFKYAEANFDIEQFNKKYRELLSVKK